MITPADNEVLGKLLRQVSHAAEAEKPEEVVTSISRPMYEAFLRAAAESSGEGEDAPDYHGKVWWTETHVIESRDFFSFSYLRLDRLSLLQRIRHKAAMWLAAHGGRWGFAFALKSMPLLTRSFWLTVWMDGKFQQGGVSKA